MFAFHLRDARIKAKVPAVVEALSLWRPFRPVPPISGPLAEKKGVFWVAIEPEFIPSAVRLLPRLGYSSAVDEVLSIEKLEHSLNEPPHDEKTLVRWRGEPYKLAKVYQEDREALRNRAVDKRVFLLESSTGEVRRVKGYRGDGATLSRRGLPVEDARLLVNLVSPKTLINKDMLFIDPFAGAGGIIIEAADAGYTVCSIDRDERLRYGLKALGAFHLVADAARLPFSDEVFTAIATEPPYHRDTFHLLLNAFDESYRALKRGGRLSMLVAEWQAGPLLQHSATRGMTLFLASRINRKGTSVATLAWEKVS